MTFSTAPNLTGIYSTYCSYQAIEIRINKYETSIIVVSL
jgi:hypothetical protein